LEGSLDELQKRLMNGNSARNSEAASHFATD